MPVDLSPEGKFHKAQQRIAELEARIEELESHHDGAHDELAQAHDALHEIVEAKGRGGLKIAKRVLGIE